MREGGSYIIEDGKLVRQAHTEPPKQKPKKAAPAPAPKQPPRTAPRGDAGGAKKEGLKDA